MRKKVVLIVTVFVVFLVVRHGKNCCRFIVYRTFGVGRWGKTRSPASLREEEARFSFLLYAFAPHRRVSPSPSTMRYGEREARRSDVGVNFVFCLYPTVAAACPDG